MVSECQILRCKDKVAHILEHHPRTRDSDKKLYFQYIAHYHINELPSSGNFYEYAQKIIDCTAPEPETIRRCRQKIQEEGKFLGEKKIERLKLAEETRKTINQSPPLTLKDYNTKW